MVLPSVDIFIGLIFLVGIGYGFMIKRDKTIATLCSIYMGLVIASSFSQTVFDFFNGNKTIGNSLWIRSNASVSTIAIIIFLLSVILISNAINSSHSKSNEVSPIEIVVYSALSVALIISSVLGFLPDAVRNHYIEISKTAMIINNLKTVIIVIPPIALIFMNLKKDK